MKSVVVGVVLGCALTLMRGKGIDGQQQQQQQQQAQAPLSLLQGQAAPSPLISSRTVSPEQQAEALDFVLSKASDSAFEDTPTPTLGGNGHGHHPAAVTKMRNMTASDSTHAEFQFGLDEMLLGLFQDAHFRVEVTRNLDRYRSLDGLCLSWAYRPTATARDPAWDLVVTCDGGDGKGGDGDVGTQSTQTPRTRTGDLVLSLGGLSSDDILTILQSTIPHENDYFLVSLPSSWWVREDFLSHFGVIRYDEQNQDQNPTVELVVERDGIVLDAVNIPLARTEETTTTTTPSGSSGSSVSSSEDSFVSYEILKESNTAVFKLDACIYDETYISTVTEFWTTVLDDPDITIDKVVVDLRDNRGGDFTVVPAFLSWVTQEPYEMFSINQRNSAGLCAQEPILCDAGTVAALAGAGVNATNEYYTIPDDVLPFVFARAVTQLDAAQLFDGDVFVLTSGVTFSSAHLFAAVVQQNDGLGTLVGSPTGNLPSFWGNLIRFEVPNTDLTIYITTSQTVVDGGTGGTDDAIMPDVFVPTTRDDILTGSDPQLEYITGSTGSDMTTDDEDEDTTGPTSSPSVDNNSNSDGTLPSSSPTTPPTDRQAPSSSSNASTVLAFMLCYSMMHLLMLL